jgi:hypothetical protein
MLDLLKIIDETVVVTEDIRQSKGSIPFKRVDIAVFISSFERYGNL